MENVDEPVDETLLLAVLANVAAGVGKAEQAGRRLRRRISMRKRSNITGGKYAVHGSFTGFVSNQPRPTFGQYVRLLYNILLSLCRGSCS